MNKLDLIREDSFNFSLNAIELAKNIINAKILELTALDGNKNVINGLQYVMFFFNNWYNLGFYVEATKRGITRKRLYLSRETGLSGWMDEDEKPSKDKWIACRVDTYFEWTKEVVGS